MFDIGVSKIMLIGGIALVVLGPERLPRVARTLGTLVGRAQRYVADVKAEVNRTMDLEEIQKVKREFETAARDVHQNVQSSLDQATQDVNAALSSGADTSSASSTTDSQWWNTPTLDTPPPPERKNWRLKRGHTPMWFKQQQGVRRHVQSGAARVARFRPRNLRR